jgi:hypothetical protein
MRHRRQPGSNALGRFLRGHRPDRNPLRRGTDRAEIAIMAVLVVAFCVIVPFAAHAAASWTSAGSHREMLAQQASFRQVRAVLLTKPVSAEAYGAPLISANARWKAPDGQLVSGEIAVPPAARAGSTVLVWTNQTGQLVTPLGPAQAATRDDMASTAAVAASVITLIVAACAVHWAADRRRLAAWEADWLITGPRWTTRR